MEKQLRKPWTKEAKARHKAGVARYQRQREIYEFGNKLFDDLKKFAMQNSYDLESTIDSFCDIVRNFESVIKNKRFKKIEITDYLRGQIEQKQIEKGIVTA